MAAGERALIDWRTWFVPAKLRLLAAPVFIFAVLAMMVLPLPPFALDLFFTFNIAMSVVVLLVAMYTVRPLDFSVFPTVLLVTTLLRLSLNVASTRVVLLHGHTGPDAAGRVIESFGHFLVGGNMAIGIVVFVILVIINFVVITKGAGRIAEVSARFTLDAMPGKQMAIDADLNAGLIDEAEARRRRKEIAQEADFYGAMDGASKFVRGDAVAGILILLINIIGGLIVGVAGHGMDLSRAIDSYVILTIGDGLVAQIPALMVSIASGMVVARVGEESMDLGDLMIQQVFTNPRVLALSSGILVLLGMIPGMPNFVFLLIGGGLGWLAWKRWAQEREETAAPAAAAAAPPPPKEEVVEASWDDVQPVDVLGLEVGYRLIPLVDQSQGGELLKRIRGLRKRFAQEVGFLPAPVHIRDNLELRPNAYRILLKGVEIGSGEVYPGQYLAINPGQVLGTIEGRPGTDPAFGLPAQWIDAALRERAHALGYTVVDAATVIATHLNQVLVEHAAELLGREETQALLDRIKKESPKLVEDLVPTVVPVTTVQKVLQYLLEEGVAIRDMRTVLETLAEWAPKTQDPIELTSRVREALGRAIVQSLAPGSGKVPVLMLDPALERILMQAVGAGGGKPGAIEPGLADALLRQTGAAAQRLEQQGQAPILLVPPQLRWLLARFLRRSVPSLRVISTSEMPEERSIEIVEMIGSPAG
ncbi:MAG: flagellar biosynthesis protein FlhA [Tepidiphilus sp.]|jgi:flagellar biosynthesis protein FlhA|uniref:Flagellar biosynthesis protein FlhA n=1 Tax=Tepidiphilus thermophilus TaxID=876478 RepID=A0A0K6IW82_9PROT|nr:MULTISPECIES: flagellar biosynthesis protein FlhA [Tepidiphilus]MBP6999402.1 flagellar biosynthesis protein FlhA [Tepidiphilus sp.]CUB07386.1 flagellar biosynthesis protein FlhA [Tepidiphilus thermophilus]